MANEICPVCEKEVHPSYREVINGVVLHAGICREKFRANESMYHEDPSEVADRLVLP